MKTIENESLNPQDFLSSVEEYDKEYDKAYNGMVHDNGPYRDLKKESFWDFVNIGIEELLKDDQFQV